MFEVAFRDGKCVGFYRASEDHPHSGPRDGRLQKYQWEVDAHAHADIFQGGRMGNAGVEDIFETAEWLLNIPRDSLITPKLEAQAAPAPINKVPAASPKPNQPAPVPQEPVPPPPLAPEPDNRPWYEMVADAFYGCFQGLVDCFKRLFGFAQ